MIINCGADKKNNNKNVDIPNPLTNPEDKPTASNPEGQYDIPEDTKLTDISNPTTMVGDGTPKNCTTDATIETITDNDIIIFNYGPDPITITLDQPAKIVNDTDPEIMIDNDSLVTLSNNSSTRILYMNTCDEAQIWTTPHYDNQDHPHLTIQNLTFIDTDSRGESKYDDGGAI